MTQSSPSSALFSPRLLDNYIFKQLLDYFLLGLVVFTLIAFFSDTLLKFIRDIQQYGIPTSTMFTLIGLQLPRSIALVLPASSFLAALMVYNQLNNQFEIIAMRAGGISLWRLMVPALALGIFCSLIGYVLNDYVVPYSNQQTARLKAEMFQKGALPVGGKSFMYQSYDDKHNLVQMIYVSHYQGQNLGDSTIIDLSKPSVMQVVQAKSGTWYPKQGWKFKNANIYLVANDTEHSSSGHSEIFFAKNLLNKQDDQNKEQEELQQRAKDVYLDSNEQSFSKLWSVIQKREAQGLRVARNSYLKLWDKITMPLSSLVIILSAVPLALTPPRQGSNLGFVFSIVILFLYYMLHALFDAIGHVNFPWIYQLIGMPTYLMLIAWTPLLLMGIIGVLLIRRKTQVL